MLCEIIILKMKIWGQSVKIIQYRENKDIKDTIFVYLNIQIDLSVQFKLHIEHILHINRILLYVRKLLESHKM